MDPRTNVLTVAVTFKDDRVVVSRATDGAYLLGGERMREDELFTALMQRQVRDDKLRVLALLEDADRVAFKTLLSDLPRNRRRTVKYIEPQPDDLR